MKHATILIASLALGLAAGTVCAKLPAPSDEAKAKADEARAKTAHGDKLAAFQLCRAMDKLAGDYAAAKKAGKPASAPTATPACAAPGAFVYVPPVAASAPAAPAATAAVVSAAPAKK